MKRRRFILSTLGASALTLPALSCINRTKPQAGNRPSEYIAGVTLQAHRDELRSMLYDEYLPFWDKGGYDNKYGGFICNLNKDGTRLRKQIPHDHKPISQTGQV